MKEVLVLAVDAGGTYCRATLCNQAGQILGFAQEGSCNYHSIGIEQATATLTMVLNSLTKEQSLQVNCAVFALAGFDTKRDQAVLTSIVHKALAVANIRAESIYLDNDAMLTLKGTVGQHHGVIIIAGTGSIACGITQDGRQVRVGGWGYRVGDEGSGYAIGREAVMYILRAYDGREGPSSITTAVLSAMSLADEDELVNWVYSPQYSIKQLAALAPIMIQLAEEKDQQAVKIITQASQALGNMVLTVIRRLNLCNVPFKVVMAGGILQNEMIHGQVVQLIKEACSSVHFVASNEQPIYASIRYGFMLLGIDNVEISN